LVIVNAPIKREGYYFIDVVWKFGLKYTVHCRGFNLKSEIAFHESLYGLKSFKYYEVNKTKYEERTWQSFSLADTEKTVSKGTLALQPKVGKTPTKAPAKRSVTKRSVHAAKKSMKKKVLSSKQTKKQKTGSSVK